MKEYTLENRIYYHDTDSGGVVYYAAYLEHLEEGRSEFCRHFGIDLVRYAAEGVLFPIVHLEIDYKASARYGDTIRIVTRSERAGNASVHFDQEIRRGETLLIRAKMVWACVNASMKPQRIPDAIRHALAG